MTKSIVNCYVFSKYFVTITETYFWAKFNLEQISSKSSLIIVEHIYFA